MAASACTCLVKPLHGFEQHKISLAHGPGYYACMYRPGSNFHGTAIRFAKISRSSFRGPTFYNYRENMHLGYLFRRFNIFVVYQSPAKTAKIWIPQISSCTVLDFNSRFKLIKL